MYTISEATYLSLIVIIAWLSLYLYGIGGDYFRITAERGEIWSRAILQ